MVDTDYITKESALSCFHDWIDRYGHEHTADEMVEYQRIEELPVADVRPVVHGTWIDKCVRDWRCSVCDYGIQKIRVHDGYCYKDLPNFCPNCGADMRGMEPNDR